MIIMELSELEDEKKTISDLSEKCKSIIIAYKDKMFNEPLSKLRSEMKSLYTDLRNNLMNPLMARDFISFTNSLRIYFHKYLINSFQYVDNLRNLYANRIYRDNERYNEDSNNNPTLDKYKIDTLKDISNYSKNLQKVVSLTGHSTGLCFSDDNFRTFKVVARQDLIHLLTKILVNLEIKSSYKINELSALIKAKKIMNKKYDNKN